MMESRAEKEKTITVMLTFPTRDLDNPTVVDSFNFIWRDSLAHLIGILESENIKPSIALINGRYYLHLGATVCFSMGYGYGSKKDAKIASDRCKQEMLKMAAKMQKKELKGEGWRRISA